MNPVTSPLLRHFGCFAIYCFCLRPGGVAAEQVVADRLRKLRSPDAHPHPGGNVHVRGDIHNRNASNEAVADSGGRPHRPHPGPRLESAVQLQKVSANSTSSNASQVSAGAKDPTVAAVAAVGPDFPMQPLSTEPSVQLQNGAALRLSSLTRSELEAGAEIDGGIALSSVGEASETETEAGMDGVSISSMVFGTILVCSAVAMLWFNEQQTVKLETLLARGLDECITVDPHALDKDTQGDLVHVQGLARGVAPLADPQFPQAVLKNCIKLQSTLEVFEWVQVTRIWLEGKERRSQPKFNSEWQTFHLDSTRFRKPSPDNPRLPYGMCLGTSTVCCQRVELGDFVLPDNMLQFFHKFEPAMELLPSKLTAHGLTFFANPDDGYYYARPGVTSRTKSVFTQHQVGDFRVRFMCVKESQVTVVGVQSGSSRGFATFVPYRPIPRSICQSEEERRQKLIFEGSRSLREFKQDLSCCHGGLATCCCCVCNTIACCFNNEVVTEEIFYISDKKEPREQPFTQAVPRNTCRVWCFRLLAWFILYMGLGLILSPVSASLQESTGLDSYGSWAPLVLAGTTTLAISAAILAVTYMFYQPVQGVKWLVITALIASAPFVAAGGSVS